MTSQLHMPDIYDKNLNFLIGSGASYGLLPTLQLKIKGTDGSQQTVETLHTAFENQSNKLNQAALLVHFYRDCIKPALQFSEEEIAKDVVKTAVSKNYEKFIDTILAVLNRKKGRKNCNVFTTNYDSCIPYAANELIKKGSSHFILNDGTRGFFHKYLDAKNYNCYTIESGAFDRYSSDLPQINLINMHGSIYWYKDSDRICIDYIKTLKSRLIDERNIPDISGFSSVVSDETKNIDDIPKLNIRMPKIKSFLDHYNALPIVNPTKWKFHETVFNEHYYQMLRYLSYELEKPNTALITFGFSFADEHILNLIRRSLSNPYLQVFISCFNDQEKVKLEGKFQEFKNVSFLRISGDLDFSAFNEKIFCISNPGAEAT